MLISIIVFVYKSYMDFENVFVPFAAVFDVVMSYLSEEEETV